MLSPSSTPPQALTPLPGAAYLYLLVSRQEPEAFKLGITGHPAMRFDTLTKRFGEFDLQASVLVAAKSRRAARDLERLLQSVFVAPGWRVKPTLAAAKNGRRLSSDGDTEWYRMSAFKAMVNFVVALAEHDYGCDLHRFEVVPSIRNSSLWREHLCNAGVQTRFRTSANVALEAQARFEKNEMSFEAVQAWMQGHRHQLASATPLAIDAQGNRRWAVVFRGDDTLGSTLDEVGEGGWDDLVSACVISHTSERGTASHTYLGGTTIDSDMSTYSVEFLITPALTQEATDCPSLGGLLTRVENWLDTLPS